MYPPENGQRAGQYSALPTDQDGGYGYASNRYSSSPFKRRIHALTKKPLFRPVLLGSAVLIVLYLLFHRGGSSSMYADEAELENYDWPSDAFNFTADKPAYLASPPPSSPVVIRLAIMSRVDEFERRHALREAMLRGIPKAYVDLTYRFFVGRDPGGVLSLPTKRKLQKEVEEFRDMMILDHVPDIPERISEKRFWAVKWTAEVPESEYDYSMTLDSDTFCRFSVLIQRLHHVYPSLTVNMRDEHTPGHRLSPRTEPIIIGRKSVHHSWFAHEIDDGNADEKLEDPHVMGPWYKYPVGIGYLLSSNLTATLMNLDPPVPHHIHYPSDDVMIGMWVAGLYELHPSIHALPNGNVNGNLECRTDDQVPGKPNEKLPSVPASCPKPYSAHPIDSLWVDDEHGWHDYKHHGLKDAPTGWETACVHRMSAKEMRAFRRKEEVKGEWDE